MADTSNTYTVDEVDALLASAKTELENKIDNVIIMAPNENAPSADITSVYMKIVDADKTI